MDRLTKLVLVTGSGRSIELGKEIENILKKYYKLTNIELFPSHKIPKLTQDQKKHKDWSRPLVADSFPDSETRAEIGREFLRKKISGKNIFVIKYMFEPNPSEKGLKVNDNLFEVLSLFNMFKQIETEKMTLVAPYLTYLRSHSIEKYIKNKGLFQANTLEMMVNYLALEKVNEILTIDPHSIQIQKYCELNNMGFHYRDPFSSSKYTPYPKLGFKTKEDAKDILKKLQPFITYYKQHEAEYKKDFKRIIIVCADPSSEDRAETFAVDTDLGFENLGYIEKERIDIDKVKLSGFKDFSYVKEKEIKEALVILIDDMVSSGTTMNENAQDLKKMGAKRIEAWSTHPVCPEIEKIEQLNAIDKIVCLDSVLHQCNKLEYIRGSSAHILSAIIFKSYMRGSAIK